ncbi:MAG: TIGR01777 family oxidoreductase [Jaaginema sp. PMC 1079.18]|nr:TIGR01777 family oxidoreductase [Jaaginema sp. PMC 1080.18]MEC4850234.1 TIGR01777 family oxidoreductase [Jaaginema sp. PMC 1079.18]MEC4867302.1 TIGR01777 family oxidoreductase [Jaaginema sp. PMC 1078.18]
MVMKIAIAGGTGFVGSSLVQKLHQRGDRIIVFSRNPDRARKVFPPQAFARVEIVPYTPNQAGDWQKAVSGCDGVVNLAGEPIAEERWSPEVKDKILQSRQQVTRHLVEAIAQAEAKPGVLVNASAVGYYGTSQTQVYDETSPPGNDFLAQVCQTWEKEAQNVKNSGTRLVILRIGIVLGNGGAIAKMITPFRLFAGGPIGSGEQWFSWIHQEDLVNLILFALDRSALNGVLNGTAPNPVSMKELCNTLGNVMQRPSWLPVPAFALELRLGDGAKVVLEGQKVLPQATEAAGFTYKYPTIEPALAAVVAEI